MRSFLLPQDCAENTASIAACIAFTKGLGSSGDPSLFAISSAKRSSVMSQSESGEGALGDEDSSPRRFFKSGSLLSFFSLIAGFRLDLGVCLLERGDGIT